MKPSYPERDRGVYRAAINTKSSNHKWALDLVNSLNTGTIAGDLKGLLKWCYRDRGSFSIIDFFKKGGLCLVAKDDEPAGKYIPVPIKYEPS